MKVRATDAALL